MPRETVYANIGPFNVEVGWHEGSEVQVATTSKAHIVKALYNDTDTKKKLFDALSERGVVFAGSLAKDGPQRAPESIVDEILDILQDVGFNYNGLWSTLNRQECNKTIALLRKARNKAYGQDQ